MNEPTIEELKAQVNILTQQRNNLSAFNLDWEARYALLQNAHQELEKKFIAATEAKHPDPHDAKD